MVRQSLFLMILLSVPEAMQAMPQGCSALAAEGSDLWIVEADQAPRHVLSAKRPIFAASWSPDRREIAFSVVPPTTEVATEVVIAEIGGRIIGRFKVDKPQSEGGLRYIEGIEWRGPRSLVIQGNQGPHGGYVDIFRLSEHHTGAERVRRVDPLDGSWCAVSPSMQYVACRGTDTIMIFDTLVPADEDGVVSDRHFFETPTSGGPDDPSEGVESNLTWDSTGLTLYAVRLENSKQVLTTIERNPASAEGWSITDREIVGIDSDSRVVSIEVDAHGALMLSTAWRGGGNGRKAYSLPRATATAPAGGVARVRVASPTELRRPTVLEAAARGKNRTFKVLDSYCESSKSQQ